MQDMLSRFFEDSQQLATIDSSFIGEKTQLSTSSDVENYASFTPSKSGYFLFVLNSAGFYPAGDTITVFKNGSQFFTGNAGNDNAGTFYFSFWVYLSETDTLTFTSTNKTFRIHYYEIRYVQSVTNSNSYSITPPLSGKLSLICNRNDTSYSTPVNASSVKINGQECFTGKEVSNGLYYTSYNVLAGIPINITTDGVFIIVCYDIEDNSSLKNIKTIQRGTVLASSNSVINLKIGNINPLKTMVFLNSNIPGHIKVNDLTSKNLFLYNDLNNNSSYVEYQLVEFW